MSPPPLPRPINAPEAHWSGVTTGLIGRGRGETRTSSVILGYTCVEPSSFFLFLFSPFSLFAFFSFSPFSYFSFFTFLLFYQACVPANSV